MDRSAVDDWLKQIVAQVIRSRINRAGFLPCVTERLSYARIQEIGTGHELGEQSEPCRIAALQLGDERGGRMSTGGGDQALESIRQIRAE